MIKILTPLDLKRGKIGVLTVAQRLELVMFDNNNVCHCTLIGIDLMIFVTTYRCWKKFDTPYKVFGFNTYVKNFRF